MALAHNLGLLLCLFEGANNFNVKVLGARTIRSSKNYEFIRGCELFIKSDM